MAGEGGFLARWSKRKRGDLVESEAVLSPAAIPVPPVSAPDEPPVQLNLPDVPEVDEPAFDLASLPTLDELTGTSDMSAFLQKGVPEALRNAALRKAWVLDPSIRDHIEPIECGWDFNDPNSMTGFGALDANVDPAAMLKQIMGQPEPAEPESAEPMPGETVSGEPLADGAPSRGTLADADAAPDASPAVSGEERENADADSVDPEEKGLFAVEVPQTAAGILPLNHAALQYDGIDKVEEFPLIAGKRRHGGAVPG